MHHLQTAALMAKHLLTPLADGLGTAEAAARWLLAVHQAETDSRQHGVAG